MKKVNLKNVLVSGIVATAAMTMLMLVAPMMGMPKMNIGKMLGSMMGNNEVLGWMAHFMIGLVLAFMYAAIFYKKFSSKGWLNGVLYSVIPFLAAQLMVMPMMMVMKGMSFSSGIFSGSFIMAMGSFMGHIVFGFVLGTIYKNS